MPIDLWLECVCDSTALGEEVAVVGNVPILGSWCPEHAVALGTSLESFPRWTLRQPLRIEEEPSQLPAYLEFKYIIRRRGDSNCRWEDLGYLTPGASMLRREFGVEYLKILEKAALRPINRHLHCCQKLSWRGWHGVSMRVDFFGSYAPLLEAAWIVPAAWEPQLAGHEGIIGPECFRVARDPARLNGNAQEALRRALLEGLCENDKPRPFVALRSRLLGGLSQLCRKYHLTRDVWRQVGDYLGGIGSSWPAGAVQGPPCRRKPCKRRSGGTGWLSLFEVCYLHAGDIVRPGRLAPPRLLEKLLDRPIIWTDVHDEVATAERESLYNGR